MRRIYLFPWILLVVGFAMPSAHAQSAMCRGVVFNDLNADGQRSRGEPGIAGVKVSDGVELAITGHDGSYRLDPIRGRIPFVIKPPAYFSATGGDGLPVFWGQSVQASTLSTPGDAGVSSKVSCQDFALRAKRPARVGVVRTA